MGMGSRLSLSESERLLGYLNVPTFDFDRLIDIIRNSVVDGAMAKHRFFKPLLLGTFNISCSKPYTYEVIKRYDVLVFRKRKNGFYIELFFRIGTDINFSERGSIINLLPNTKEIVFKNNTVLTDIWYHVLPNINIVFEKDGHKKYFIALTFDNKDHYQRHRQNEHDLSVIVSIIDDDASAFIIKNYDIFKSFYFMNYDYAKGIYRI